MKVFYTDSENNVINTTSTQVVLFIDDDVYNLSYESTEMAWMALLSSDIAEDITLTFKGYDPAYQCKNTTTTIKIRIPFYYTVRLFKGGNYTNNDIGLMSYKNDFQYIYFSFYNTSDLPLSDLRYIDRLFSWVPFYKDSFTHYDDVYGVANTRDTFWSDYRDGQGTVKLYECCEHNYSIYILSTRLKGLSWEYEFIKPQIEKFSYDSKIIKDFRPRVRENTTMDIYISAWEISKFNFTMNIVKWIVIICIWLTATFFITQASWKATVPFTIGYFTIIKMMGWL